LLDHGYQPEHTLLFVATDAEEFGAPDTHFDWLIGCHCMLGAHAEWRGRISAAFNIDTLALLAQEQLGFISPPELLPFLQAAVGDYEVQTFPQSPLQVKQQVTAWTEVLTYAYFGIPPLQPRFALEEAKRTIYHTQFDDSSIVHQARAAETVQLYGTLLVRFDRQPILPYELTLRAQSLRATIENPTSETMDEELAALRQALDRLEQRSEALNLLLAPEDRTGLAQDAINDRLRQAAGYLIAHLNYLDATAPEDALPLHVFYDRDLRALDAALSHLALGEAQQAMATLTDHETGLRGAWCALEMSYPVYHRHAIGGWNPGRQDLFWGEDRTATITDVWAELHTLQDKLARGVTDFGPEEYALRAKRESVTTVYRSAIRQLTRIVEEAAAMLPL
jgi:hypothetical protein